MADGIDLRFAAVGVNVASPSFVEVHGRLVDSQVGISSEYFVRDRCRLGFTVGAVTFRIG